MDRNVAVLGLGLLLLFSSAEAEELCLDPASAYRFTGAVCRLTYPAAVVCK